MANARQFALYLSGAGNLSGVTSVTSRQNWGRARVTSGMTRRTTVAPAKFRNGLGRKTEDTGEFVPGLAGLSS